MSAYRSYIEAQRLLALNGLDVKILSSAFSKLPHLESLYFDFWDNAIGFAEFKYAFGEFAPRELLTYECRYTLPVLVQTLAASPAKIKVFQLGADEHSYRSIFSGPATISAQALSETLCTGNLEICKNAFSGLRELRIGEIEVQAYEISRVPNALRDLMQCALGLEVITLEGIYSSVFNGPLPRPSLDNVMPSCGLNNIKELCIHHYDTSVVALSNLFRRNKQTIIKIDFEDILITGSDWPTALVHLRTLDLPRLEVFFISFCDGMENRLQVQDYVLKKTDRDPIAEAKERRWREYESKRILNDNSGLLAT